MRTQFFKSVAQALLDFNELNPIAPLQLMLEVIPSVIVTTFDSYFLFYSCRAWVRKRHYHWMQYQIWRTICLVTWNVCNLWIQDLDLHRKRGRFCSLSLSHYSVESLLLYQL
jgi:hypothetical protein